MPRLTALTLALLIAACGPSDGADGPPTAAATGGTFSDDLEDQACSVLTAEVVSEITGVSADAFEQSPAKDAEFGPTADDTDRCSYTWGDKNVAQVASLDVHRDAERAASYFASMTATQTRGDMADAMGAIGDQIDRQREAGEMSERDAENAGAFAEGMGGAVADGDRDEILSQYEPVAGIGDEAAIQEGEQTMEVMGMTVTNYNSTLIVRRGNAVFLVAAQIYDAAGEIDPARTAEVTRALGRAVASRLGD